MLYMVRNTEAEKISHIDWVRSGKIKIGLSWRKRVCDFSGKNLWFKKTCFVSNDFWLMTPSRREGAVPGMVVQTIRRFYDPQSYLFLELKR